MPRHAGNTTRAKKGDDARSKAWTSMHILRMFTMPDLAMTAGIKMDNCRYYLVRLEQFGFVRRVRRNDSGHAGSHSLWQLVRHTGPDAPIAQKSGGLFDPNTGKTYTQTEDGYAVS